MEKLKLFFFHLFPKFCFNKLKLHLNFQDKRYFLCKLRTIYSLENIFSERRKLKKFHSFYFWITASTGHLALSKLRLPKRKYYNYFMHPTIIDISIFYFILMEAFKYEYRSFFLFIMNLIVFLFYSKTFSMIHLISCYWFSLVW